MYLLEYTFVLLASVEIVDFAAEMHFTFFLAESTSSNSDYPAEVRTKASLYDE